MVGGFFVFISNAWHSTITGDSSTTLNWLQELPTAVMKGPAQGLLCAILYWYCNETTTTCLHVDTLNVSSFVVTTYLSVQAKGDEIVNCKTSLLCFKRNEILVVLSVDITKSSRAKINSFRVTYYLHVKVSVISSTITYLLIKQTFMVMHLRCKRATIQWLVFIAKVLVKLQFLTLSRVVSDI